MKWERRAESRGDRRGCSKISEACTCRKGPGDERGQRVKYAKNKEGGGGRKIMEFVCHTTNHPVNVQLNSEFFGGCLANKHVGSRVKTDSFNLKMARTGRF